jgi:REP element-mobilizing transposase RayT
MNTTLDHPRRAGVSPAMPSNGGQDARPPFFDPHAEIEFSEHRLPHWQQGEAWIFATWRLADSLPAKTLRDWQLEKENWLRLHPEPWADATVSEFHERFSGRMEAWLDAGHGACLLRDPETRELVTAALAHFAGARYVLGDYVVMPNHVHVLFRPLGTHRIEDLLHSWKSFTAKAINRHLRRAGPVWQEDYWDRLIRHERHWEACRRYIAENPAKAGLPSTHYSHRRAGVSPAIPSNGGQDARPPLAATAFQS